MRQDSASRRAMMTLLCILVATGTAAATLAAAAQLPDAAGDGTAAPGLQPTQDPDPETLELGAEIYRSQCMSCHGRQGKGDGPAARFVDPQPRDLTAGEWEYAEDGSIEAIATLVAAGIGDTAMEPFEELLTQEEIDAVAAFVVHEIAPASEGGDGR